MHRDKTAARIILILSVVHVAVAAPAVVRQRSLDVAKNVTPALEKRGNSEDKSSVDLNPVPQIHSNPPPPQDEQSLTSGASPSQDHAPPAPEDPVHNDPLAGSGDTAQPHDYPFRWWEHSSWRPTGQTEQGESSSQFESGAPKAPPTTSGTPQVQDKLLPASETPQVHNDQPTTVKPPSVHHESFSSGDFDSSWRWVNDLRHVEGAPSSLHSETEVLVPPAVTSLTTAATTATTDPEVEALKGKLKAYTAFGTILGLGGGIGTGMVIGSGSGSGSYVSALFPPSPPNI